MEKESTTRNKKGKQIYKQGQTMKERYKTGQKALTPTQAEKLLASCINLEHEALIKLALSTGMRRSDVVKITEANINFKDNYVEFEEMKKRNKIKRTYISKGVLNTLSKWIQLKPKSKYLFPSKRTKTHISDRTAYNYLQANLKCAGLPNRPFHALRATCYKIAQARGWTQRQAAEHIGDSLRVAEEHYGAPSTEEMHTQAQESPII